MLRHRPLLYVIFMTAADATSDSVKPYPQVTTKVLMSIRCTCKLLTCLKTAIQHLGSAGRGAAPEHAHSASMTAPGRGSADTGNHPAVLVD